MLKTSLAVLPLLLVLPLASATPPCDYAVVVSQRTHDDPQWKKVVEALVKKHAEEYHAQVVVYAEMSSSSRARSSSRW